MTKCLSSPHYFVIWNPNSIDPLRDGHGYDRHPKDMWIDGSGLPRQVPAHEVMHIFMPDRFTGTRGYPWGASALNTSESLRTYEIAELERKKGQTNFLGVMKKPRLAAEDDGSVVGDDEDEIEAPTVDPMEPNTIMVVPDDYDFALEQPTATDRIAGRTGVKTCRRSRSLSAWLSST